MIRIINKSGKWYGINVDITDEEEQENINMFVTEGPVILVDSLEDLSRIYLLDASDIEMIGK